ncbi:MAG: addiction module antitoxin [Acidimicrobiia bacterium]|nr:addiction module antitoxin [Acidimicrobiia bacterium]
MRTQSGRDGTVYGAGRVSATGVDVSNRPATGLVDTRLEAAYREMAADEARKSEALAWSEGLIGDAADGPR